MTDKFDDAIEFLNTQDQLAGGGSYFGECASLFEELLGQLYEAKEKIILLQTPVEEIQTKVGSMTFGAKAWAERMR